MAIKLLKLSGLSFHNVCDCAFLMGRQESGFDGNLKARERAKGHVHSCC